MINRLNDILKNYSNIKFRRGYIKYLKSLDFKEYEKIFIHYMSIIQTVIIRYDSSRFFSRRWFKKQFLQLKFNKLYDIFSEANFDYLIKVKDNMDIINKKREKILIDIKNKKDLLNNVQQEIFIRETNNLSIPQALIYFNISMINNIYLTNELEKLMKELNELNNHLNEKFRGNT